MCMCDVCAWRVLARAWLLGLHRHRGVCVPRAALKPRRHCEPPARRVKREADRGRPTQLGLVEEEDRLELDVGEREARLAVLLPHHRARHLDVARARQQLDRAHPMVRQERELKLGEPLLPQELVCRAVTEDAQERHRRGCWVSARGCLRDVFSPTKMPALERKALRRRGADRLGSVSAVQDGMRDRTTVTCLGLGLVLGLG